MIVGQYLIAIGTALTSPGGQRGSVAGFPQHAGRAAAISSFLMMLPPSSGSDCAPLASARGRWC